MLNSVTDEQLGSMTIGQVEELFKTAKIIGVDDKMADEFWSRFEKVRQNQTSLQQCLNYLEAYKRNIGAAYTRTHNKVYKYKYNDLENNIEWLAKTYKLNRTTKSYKLGDSNND